MQLRAKHPFRSPWTGYVRRGAIIDVPEDVAAVLTTQGHVRKAAPDFVEVMREEAGKAAPKPANKAKRKLRNKSS